MLFLARVSPPFVVNLILCPRLCVPWVSLISALIGQVALWVRIACPFSAPPPDWRLIVAVHPRPLGCPLFCCFGWFLSVFFRWLSPFAWLCAFVGSCLFCGLSVSPPFALGLSVVLLVVCVAVSPPSPSVVPGWRPGPFKLLLYWSLPLGIWLLLATAWLPYLLLGVLWCSASSLHVAPRQQRPLALCGVTGLPSTPWGICCCGALRSFTEVFIFMMIQVPP